MHIAFLTTEYPILGMKCGGIGIFYQTFVSSYR